VRELITMDEWLDKDADSKYCIPSISIK